MKLVNKLLKRYISNIWISIAFRLPLILVISILACSCDSFDSQYPPTSTEYIDQECTSTFTTTPEISPTIVPSVTVDSTPEGLDTGFSIISDLSPGQYVVYSTITGIDDKGVLIGTTKIISIDGKIETTLFDDYYEKASISPEYQYVAFNKDRMIYILSLNDNSIQPIAGTEECRSPRWSPDGEMLAIECVRNDKDVVVLRSLNEEQTYQLLQESLHISSLSPLWSPDGKWVAYIGGEFRSGVRSELNGIYITTSQSILSGETLNYRNTIGPIIWTEQFSWSPNGEQLAFISDENAVDIYNIQTRSMKYLGQYDEIMLISGNVEWSPDGNWIAFSTMEGIYLLNVNDSVDPRLVKEGNSPYLNFWIKVE